jgi:acetyltransferase-like isoleucine patch superfamily enzyme
VLRRLIERLVAWLKHEPGYRLEGEYASADLLEILWRRGLEVFRGWFVRLRVRSSGGIVFAGRHVTIRHGRHVEVGAQLIIGDGALIDGFGSDGIRLGRNVTIGRGAALVATGVVARPGTGIRVGDRTGIGDHSFIGGQGGVEIGSDVLMGPGVHVFSENHRFDRSDIPLRLQGEERSPVVVEDDCWIGGGATILGGVRLGRGTVVAARAVVTADTPPNSLVAGIPARVVRPRATPTES